MTLLNFLDFKNYFNYPKNLIIVRFIFVFSFLWPLLSIALLTYDIALIPKIPLPFLLLGCVGLVIYAYVDIRMRFLHHWKYPRHHVSKILGSIFFGFSSINFVALYAVSNNEPGLFILHIIFIIYFALMADHLEKEVKKYQNS